MPKEFITIADLTPDSRNPRKHGERNIRAISKSLEEVGAARSIVIDENGVVLAGNGLLEGASIAGIEKVQVVETDGNTIIAVRRSNLSEKQKQRLKVLDNRSSELAEWDAGVLGEMLDEGIALDDLFFENELSKILDGFEVPDFSAVGIEEQGRLDEKAKCTCPNCKHEFTP